MTKLSARSFLLIVNKCWYFLFYWKQAFGPLIKQNKKIRTKYFPPHKTKTTATTTKTKPTKAPPPKKNKKKTKKKQNKKKQQSKTKNKNKTSKTTKNHAFKQKQSKNHVTQPLLTIIFSHTFYRPFLYSISRMGAFSNFLIFFFDLNYRLFLITFSLED